MFIALYQFSVKPGHEQAFRQAWLELTKAFICSAAASAPACTVIWAGSLLATRSGQAALHGKAPVIFSWMSATGAPGNECARRCWRMKRCLKWK